MTREAHITAQASLSSSEGDITYPAEVKETPLPWGQLSILCVVLLTESVCSTVLIPFVPSLIASIKGWNVEESGYASGFPVGLFMLGQVFSGKMWGALSDTVGRKLAITVGVMGCAICMFFFGLSGSVWAICLWRFVHGLVAGCSIVAKTMINDLTDATNRAKGMALVSLTWGVGTLFGPAAGGYLYDPASSSSLAFLHISPTSFLGKHPALLPSTVVAVYNLFAVFVSVMCLQESNREARPLRSVLPPPLGIILAPVLRLIQPRLPCDNNAADVAIVCERDYRGLNNFIHRHQANTDNHLRRTSMPPRSFGFKAAFLNPLLRSVCVISMLISVSDMVFAQIFPLWLAADIEHGGLELSPSRMANLVLVNSGPAILANIVFARLIQCSGGPTTLWVASQITYAFLTAVMPVAIHIDVNRRFWYTMAFGMLRKVVECWCFALIMVFVSLTAPRGNVGIMFGIQQSTACMVRCVVPFIFAPLFAWSIEKPRPFPFNHHLVFLLSVIPLLIGAYLSHGLILPSESGTGDREEEEEEEEDCLLEMEDSSNGLCSGSTSAEKSARVQYSYLGFPRLGSQGEQRLSHNSLVNLPISISRNVTAGMMQHNFLSGLVGAPLPIPDEQGASIRELQLREEIDSRPRSCQECDEVVVDDGFPTHIEGMRPKSSTSSMKNVEPKEKSFSEKKKALDGDGK